MTRAALALALLVAGCGPEQALQRGGEVFRDPGFARADSNVYACSTCHSAQKGGDPMRKLPGYGMYDAATRPSWWGGAYDTLFDAANECYVEFMRGQPLTRDDPEGRALLVYLDSVAPDPSSPALPETTVPAIITDPMLPGYVASGDAGRGAVVWQQACSYCHGDLHTGKGRLGPKVSIVPEESLAQHGTDPNTGARPITVEKVRHGKFYSVGGNMPQYSLEALSDADLGDLLAYMGF